MHYYKRNIGDYHKKAGRLSMIEHGAYTLLIDACYDRERFPTRDDAIDWLWARSDEEIAAIDFVLSKFFHLQDDGTYTQDRIQDELDVYHAMAETNQRIAREREAKRREARNKKKGVAGSQGKESRSVHEACETVNEAPPNQEPLTTNHEPLTNINIPFDEFWDLYDYKKGKKSKIEAKWESLKDSDRIAIMDNIPAYKSSTPDKQFRKQPMAYLNNEAWLDEIVQSKPKQPSNNQVNNYEGQSDYNNFTQSVQQQLMQQFEREDAQETNNDFSCRNVYPMEDQVWQQDES